MLLTTIALLHQLICADGCTDGGKNRDERLNDDLPDILFHFA